MHRLVNGLPKLFAAALSSTLSVLCLHGRRLISMDCLRGQSERAAGLCAALAWLGSISLTASAMQPQEVAAIVARCAPTVAPSTMQAILRVESGFRPHAIGYLVRSPKGKFNLTRQPASKQEAVSWASWMYSNGYKFDAGPAQVNSTNFARYGLTPETAFEPCQNIGAGAAILTTEYLRASRRYGPGQDALRAAISSYNSGNFSTGFANGYVKRVSDAAARSAPPPLQPLVKSQSKLKDQPQ